MDAIDILRSLLGRKSSGSGRGPDILKDIFKRGSHTEPRKPADSRSTPSGPHDLAEEARELEDLLNVSHEREATRKTGQPQQSSPRRAPADGSLPVDRLASKTRDEGRSRSPSTKLPQNEQALILVRAMLNAAKADGQISSAEQQSILEQFGDTSADAIRFLRDELSQPLDVRDFAWSVPLGMEQQVYAMSLIAIDVDSQAETEYLRELAHGLRLPAEVRTQLHQRYGID